MLHFQVDPHAGLPVYRQLMDQIKYYAASGALAPGDRLPSIRSLARQLAVNPSTVVKAFTELQHEGVVEMRQGKGAFLTAGSPTLSTKEKEATLATQARQLAVEARQLGVSREHTREILDREWERLQKGDM